MTVSNLIKGTSMCGGINLDSFVSFLCKVLVLLKDPWGGLWGFTQ